MKKTWLGLGLALVLAVAGEAPACPNCKEAVAAQTGDADAQTADAARLKNGYYYSILFMVSMPFVLLGTGALLVARAVKRGALPEW